MSYKSEFVLSIISNLAGKAGFEQAQQAFRATASAGGKAAESTVEKWRRVGGELLRVAGTIYGLKKAFDFAKEGELDTNVSMAFERLNAHAQEALGRLKEAVGNTLETTEIEKFSNRLRLMGVDTESIVKTAELARKAAAALGSDLLPVMEAVSVAAATGRTLTLAQYGIAVKARDANKEYADSLGVTADSLTKAQNQQALLNKVLSEGEKVFGAIPVDELNSKISELGARLAEIRSDFTVLVNLAVVPLIESMESAGRGAAALVLWLSQTKVASDAWTHEMPANIAAQIAATEAAEKATLNAAEAEKALANARGQTAQAMAVERSPMLEQAALLKELGKLWTAHGHLNELTIDQLEERKSALDRLLPSIHRHVELIGEETGIGYELSAQYKADILDTERLIGLKQAEAAARDAANATMKVAASRLAMLRALGADTEDPLKKIFDAAVAGKAGSEEIRKLSAGIWELNEAATSSGIVAGMQSVLDMVTVSGNIVEERLRKQAERRGSIKTAEVRDISAKELQLRLLLAETTDREIEIMVKAQLEELRLGEAAAAKRIGAREIEAQQAEVLAQREQGLAELRLERQKDLAGMQADLIRQANRDALDALREQDRMDQEAMRAQERRLADFRATIMSASSEFGSVMGDLQRMGWDFAGNFTAAMDNAAKSAQVLGAALASSSGVSGVAMLQGAAYAGKAAAQFIEDNRAKSYALALTEVGLAAAAYATGNIPAGIGHTASAGLLFYAAAKGKVGGAGGAGAATRGSSGGGGLPMASERATERSENITVNITGYVGNETALAEELGRILNAGAGRVKLDKRVVSDMTMGF